MLICARCAAQKYVMEPAGIAHAVELPFFDHCVIACAAIQGDARDYTHYLARTSRE